MGIPFGGGGDDGNGPEDFFSAEQAFSELPGDWQSDPYVQNLYSELMDADNWSDAKIWHDYLQDYIYDHYDANFDDYFDWADWRENYNMTH